MNTETFGKTLLDLYRISRSVPITEFQRRALDAVSARFDFDSAWWGMASRDVMATGLHGVSLKPGQDIDVHMSLPYRLPASYPKLWNDIKDDDIIAQAVMSAPGTTVSFARKQLYASPGLASLLARFGIVHCMCTVTLLPELNLMCFLSLYRLEGKPAFTENERRYKQLLMPHLTSALHGNWMLHLERARSAHGKPAANRSLAVVDRRGMLHVGDYGLSDMMRTEWPNWSGPLLPDVLRDHLQLNTSYSGQRLKVRFHPIADLWMVELRAVTLAERLTPREAEIARRFSQGENYKEIARALAIAPATARHHLREVYHKLGVSDKAELVHALSAEADELFDDAMMPVVRELPGAASEFDRALSASTAVRADASRPS